MLRVQIVYKIGAHSRGPPPWALSPSRGHAKEGQENGKKDEIGESRGGRLVIAFLPVSQHIPRGSFPPRFLRDADAELLLANDAFMGSVKRFGG